MNECHPNAPCINTQGSYHCSCHPTYVGNGFECKADQCYHYKNLSYANRKISYVTPYGSELCESQLPKG
ncbi:unnamed protein product [Pocillopora meandrina]|uniref:EGF-like domain-containing protein n=1 Tax=Pocillopora meandrina TaxID=46732 RepID=A0AAU9XXS3_9CNID|nr:unnamed protein product [Pocillopora meandrina]